MGGVLFSATASTESATASRGGRGVSGGVDEVIDENAMENWVKLTKHFKTLQFRRRTWASLGHFLNFELKNRVKEGMKYDTR